MKINLIGNTQTIMDAPYSNHNYFGWPTVARLKNGRIAVGASGFRITHVCPFGKAVIAYGDENGEHFSPPAIVIDTPLDDRDVGLCPFGGNGLIVTSFNNTREFQRKVNERDRPAGSTRSKYINAYLDTVSDAAEKKYLGNTFRISHDNGISFGPLYKSPVTSPHGPRELSDGRILWVGTEGADISAYTVNVDTGDMERMGSINTDEIKSLGRIPCEPYAIELENGDLLCHIRADSGKKDAPAFTLYQSRSTDGGMTWSEPRQLLEDFGGAPSHILKHSSGVLICVYSYRLPPYGIKAMFSSDGGNTWSEAHYLYSTEAGHDLGYPSTVELSDGSLMTVFYAKAAKDEPAKIYSQKWSIEK